jgi:hypothetical protein
MTTYSFLFIDQDENIDRSRQVACSTDEQAMNTAKQEPGSYRAIQIWDGYRFIGIVESIMDRPGRDVHEAGIGDIRIIDLYNRIPDRNHSVLWKHAVQVVPVSAFERIGGWIRSGHYVIGYKGDAIVVHCGNSGDKKVNVQFMMGGPVEHSVARSTIEPMLLGKLVVSEERHAAVFEPRRLSDFFKSEEHHH